ncbi:hypothetical protein CHS0354_037316 [Potamilus streckersoni]|uniref:Uncharacterized protein n=1 Tax=Potamilus streckersoni TaxID=2493646 RepID=A0AAE0TJW3_9BIVA|nr:hypothetical protein CHS0354_037316 [Potamilus streckersoni]
MEKNVLCNNSSSSTQNNILEAHLFGEHNKEAEGFVTLEQDQTLMGNKLSKKILD